MKNILAVAFILSISLCFVNESFSQSPGTLDQGFANYGELGDSIVIPPFIYSSLALSPGDEFVVSNVSGNTIQVTRYTSGGNRDINFGLNPAGYVQIVTPGFSGSVTTSLVQTDQKILIAGQYASTGAKQEAYLLRLNADGTVDNTFGASGWFFFNFFPHNGESIRQIALQTNGNIVALDVEGYTGFTDTFVVARVKSNGTYDSSFATNGAYQVPFYNFLSTGPASFTLDANNNFTCAAYSNYNTSDYLYLFQLNQNGVANVAYGNGGSILIDSTNIINGDADFGLNFQSDGKLITVQSKQTGSLLWAVCRYNTDGTPDQSFGHSGMINVQPNLDPVPYSVQNITSTVTGQIITAGVVNIAGANRLIVNSFNADGSIDATFGNNQGSELLNSFQWDDILYNVLIQPDNKILINGLINEVDYQQFEVARLIGTTGSASSAGIKELNDNMELSVYPNPANNEVSAQLSGSGTGTITLKDITGHVIITKAMNNTVVQTLDISQLAAGVYVVSCLDNESVVSKMIIKQ